MITGTRRRDRDPIDRTRGRWGPLVLCVVGLVACSSEAEEPVPLPSSTTTSSAVDPTSEALDAAVEQVQITFELPEDVAGSGFPGALARRGDTGWETFAAHDEDATTTPAGSRVVVHYACAGTGQLTATLTVGAVSASSVTECTTEGAQGSVQVDVAVDSQPTAIDLAPGEGALVAAAYYVTT